MIHYTPLAESDIYPTDMNSFSSKEIISYAGRMMYAEKMQDGTYQIQQLLSSDPQDFLRTEFSPGRIL